MAEFALTVPMALLMVLFGLDFGRVFLGWVTLTRRHVRPRTTRR